MNIADKDDDTALKLAVKQRHIEVVQAILQSGADVNIQDEEGETPLMIAADLGYLEVVQALLAAGADVECEKL